MKFRRVDGAISFDPETVVRYTEMGNVTEIMVSTHRSQGGYITKLDADTYVDNRTGEVKEFQRIENRAQDLANVAKSLKRLRDLLNANITDVTRCRWVTLTYAENMTDPNRLRKDAEHCIGRLRKRYGHFEYITAAEPQGRGAWHLHCVFIFQGKAPYMANDVVRDCWKRGFVTVKKLDNVDNVGAYLTAYLGDMEYTDEIAGTVDGTIKHVQDKSYLKGARLHLYPPKFNIYRKSKGIKEPDVSYMPYKKAKEKASSGKLTFTKAVVLEDDDTGFSRTLQYEYYNRIRR